MTLRERRGGSEKVYQDDEKLTNYQWAKMIDGSKDGVVNAIQRGGAKVEIREFRSYPYIRQLTPVGDFPKIVAGMATSPRHAYPWIPDIDFFSNFQVTTPSDTVLIYEYPRSKTIFNAIKRFTSRILCRA